MDLRQIRYFVTLFDEGSVTKAARRLGVVQPALSMQIRRLEEEFQTRLFERTSRGVDPTPSARGFYELCLSILARVDDAGRYLRDAGEHVTGHVSIGLMPSIAASAMGSTLLDYADHYPDVRLTVVEAYSDDLLERLLDGALDLAVINGSAGLAQPAIHLLSDRLALVTRPDPGASPREHSIAAAELSRFRLVLPSLRQGMRRLLDEMLGGADLDISADMEIDSLNTALDLVRHSDYATVLPVLAVHRFAEAGLVRYRVIVAPEIRRDIVVAYHQQRPPGLAGKLLVDVMRRRIGEMFASVAGDA